MHCYTSNWRVSGLLKIYTNKLWELIFSIVPQVSSHMHSNRSIGPTFKQVGFAEISNFASENYNSHYFSAAKFICKFTSNSLVDSHFTKLTKKQLIFFFRFSVNQYLHSQKDGSARSSRIINL